MKSLKIKNLRALKDTGDIELKPLTVLVGKNSSGKSTFLRFFPLLKQSFTRTTNEPVLWYEQTGVDFGSFKESFNKKAINKSYEFMEFTFKFALNKLNSFIMGSNIFSDENLVEVTMKIKNKNIYELCINFEKMNISFIINSEEDNTYDLYINNKRILSKLTNISNDSYSVDKILPTFRYKSNSLDNSNFNKGEKHSEILIRDMIEQMIIIHILAEKNEINSLDSKSLKQLASDLNVVIDQFEDDFDSVINLANFSEIFSKKITDKIIDNHDFLSQIFDTTTYDSDNEKILNGVIEYLENPSFLNKDTAYTYLFGCYLDTLLEKINYYLNSFFSNVHYIAPVRASAERYYRTQGLSVNEIDPRGDNIPFALNYLSKEEKRDFQQWTKQKFNFYFDTEEKFGHINLNVKFSNNDKINLTDTGFGFSQILPIILLLWNSESKDKFDSRMSYIPEKTIVIEQPELHLHPALQAKLLDVLINCINEINNNYEKFNIIIETHSETIINRIGQSIYSDKIKANDVNLLIFDNKDMYSTNIIKANFDDKGILNNWPLGFFYPEV